MEIELQFSVPTFVRFARSKRRTPARLLGRILGARKKKKRCRCRCRQVEQTLLLHWATAGAILAGGACRGEGGCKGKRVKPGHATGGIFEVRSRLKAQENERPAVVDRSSDNPGLGG